MDWALPTNTLRIQKRLASSPEEIREFYSAITPMIDPIIEHLNQFPLDKMPQEQHGLFNLLMAIAEVGIYAEWFNGATEPPIAAGLGGKVQMRWEPQPLAMQR